MVNMNIKFLLLHMMVGLSFQMPGHDCERTCKANDVRTCHYEFDVTTYATMSDACGNCGKYNIADCARERCVPADGVPRPIRVVNHQMPGPAIQVCEGDRLIVDVHTTYNKLAPDLSDSTVSIHWHGQWQNGSQYMDGVPYVTQCPIGARRFRYDMPYLNSGTYWYHSHSGLQRGDGVFGAMVVRRINDQQASLYDTDLPSHVLMLQDWTHKTMRAMFLEMLYRGGNDYANTILVNGKGRNTMQTEPIPFPYETIEVTQGKRHRLRIISGTAMTCPILMSIDKHDFTIIATDGEDINPTRASSLAIYSGERFDIVLNANQHVANYWIRFNGLLDCEQNKAYQGTILRYERAPKEDPKAALYFNTTPPPGIHVNPTASFSNPGYPNYMSVAQLTGSTSTDPSLLKPKTDKQFYLYFEINEIDAPDITAGKTFIPQINNISFVFPTSPPLSQPDDILGTFCEYGDQNPPCQGDYCRCTQVLEVEMNKTVEIILVNGGHIGPENHPYHLHGYSFYVVAMEQVGTTLSVSQVKAMDAARRITRNLNNPILKDTVTIPYGSYTIIRFTANNPGWWLMHCHINFHVDLGMAAVLKVGKKEDLPPVPDKFPWC